MKQRVELSRNTARRLRDSIINEDYNGIINSLVASYNEIYIKTGMSVCQENKMSLRGIREQNKDISTKELNRNLKEFWDVCDENNVWVPVNSRQMSYKNTLTEADDNDGEDEYVNSYGYDDRNEEQLSGDVEKDFDRLIQLLRDVPFEGLGDALDKVCSDPKLYNLLKLGFGEGKLADVKMGTYEKTFSAIGLIPTQNEIGLDASLKYALSGKSNIDDYFKSPALAYLPRLVIYNGQFIIDGHHRWSQIYIVNPKATIRCVNFTYRKDNPIILLRNMQGAIAVANKGIEKHKVKGVSNLFAMDKSAIESYIDENITDTCTNGLIKNKVCSDRNGAIEYLTKNAMFLKNNNRPYGDAPNREAMPQTNDASIDVASDGQTNI